MIVLGVDQSEAGQAGFAVLDLSVKPQPALLHTYLETYKLQDGYHNVQGTRKRNRRFAKVLQRLILGYSPVVVVTEQVRAFHHGKVNANTIRRLAEMQGILHVLVPAAIPIVCIDTQAWQRVMLAPKRGDDCKQLSVALVKWEYGIEASEHICDAIHMARAYLALKDVPGKVIVMTA